MRFHSDKYRVVNLIVALVISAAMYAVFLTSAEAHSIGQPPYFLVNGKYANLYPVPLTSLSNFDLPQDLAPENYLVNQTINFELDINKLPAPPDIVRKTQFTWEFGDGSKGSGIRIDHLYSKTGSFILNVYADDGTTPTSQLLDKVLVNVLPSQDYQLPKAVIKVNGKISSDPLTDILEFDLGDNLNFDGSDSKSSSKIVSYFWDFSDQSSSNNMKTVHSYKIKADQVFPVLRIKTSDGFIADNFVEIKNSNFLQGQPVTGVQTPIINKPIAPSQLKWSILVIAISVLGGLIARKRLKK
jgi:hypothetical protein